MSKSIQSHLGVVIAGTFAIPPPPRAPTEIFGGSYICFLPIQAWDTLFWFAVLVGMSSQLNSQGVVAYFSDSIGGKLTAMNLGWPAVFGLLNLVYFGLHYIFASQTAHVGALYAAFLAMMVASGIYCCLLLRIQANFSPVSPPPPPPPCPALSFISMAPAPSSACSGAFAQNVTTPNDE